jgi:hypothetical protein
MRTVRTHDKLRHVCATQSVGTRLNIVILGGTTLDENSVPPWTRGTSGGFSLSTNECFTSSSSYSVFVEDEHEDDDEDDFWRALECQIVCDRL